MGRILLSIVMCCIFLCFASAYEYVEGGSRGEGDSCTDGSKEGTCTLATQCHVYIEGGYWWKMKVCGFIGTHPVYCCPTRPTTTTTSTTTITPRPATTTSSRSGPTEYIPPTYDYVENDVAPDGCSHMPPNRTTEPTGFISWDKCIEHQMQLVYPCEESVTLIEGKARADKCHHNADVLIVGGEDAGHGEFPHMVLLGYGQTNGTAVWKCGGTLISDRFILTAAHCTRAKGLGYVSYAIVGALKRTDDVKPWQVHGIKRIIKHPDFKPRTKHNDIALLEVNPITLNEWTVPACLDVFGGNLTQVIATGWGATSFLGEEANTLQKVTLTKFTDRECRDHYPVKSDGVTFNSTIQTCYGDYTKISDTCQGDSGGPLIILNRRLHCMYTVVGITSFGINCGTRGQPGWYTKVSQYVPWIESIVWP